MAKKIKYCQCTMEKDNKDGSISKSTAWIPEKFSKVGDIIKIKLEDDSWSNGWKVVLAGEARSEDLLPNAHKTIKEHRKRTGDSMSKQ